MNVKNTLEDRAMCAVLIFLGLATSVIIIGASIAIFSEDARKPASSAAVGQGFKVDQLFTHQGCTVYRFTDQGRTIHYTSCSGASSSDTTWTEACGKNCTREVNVQTIKKQGEKK